MAAVATYKGKVCVKHPELNGERYRSDRSCMGCKSESSARWQRENPEKRQRIVERFLEANPGKASAYSRRWQIDNREKDAASKKRWWRANPEKLREYERRWRAKNPGAVNTIVARRRARKLEASPSLTAIERARVQEFYDIAAARTAQTGEQWHVDHDKPLARGGLHHPDNLVLLPASINSAKGAWFDSTIDFLLS